MSISLFLSLILSSTVFSFVSLSFLMEATTFWLWLVAASSFSSSSFSLARQSSCVFWCSSSSKSSFLESLRVVLESSLIWSWWLPKVTSSYSYHSFTFSCSSFSLRRALLRRSFSLSTSLRRVNSSWVRMTSKDSFIDKQYNKSNSLLCRVSEIAGGGREAALILWVGAMFYYSISMKGSKEGIRQIVEDFSRQHLRASVAEDEKLELDVGYQWKSKPVSPPEEQESKSSTNRLCSDRDSSQYFSLAMLFFSEMASESPLDIDLLDTMFFQPDHSVHYLYRDARKGLVRSRQRGINACEAFLKRKLRKRESVSSKERMARKYRTVNSLEERSEKSIKEELGYIALLKYKDGSFLRLRESDLRSIFTNPLYANEKFRHNNCTQYIQALPQEGSEECRVHFSWLKHAHHPLARLATNCQLGAHDCGERAAVRLEIAESDPLAYLYFTIFEICSFICIHYNRRVETATFHFVREGESWALAGIEGARVGLLEQREYIKANLWEESRKVTFGECPQNEKEIFKLKEEAKSPFYRKVEALFDATNAAIRTDMLRFVQRKIDNVKRSSDKLLSRTIFHTLHPEMATVNLYDLLDSPHHLARLTHQRARKQPRGQAVAREGGKGEGRRAERGRGRAREERFVYRGMKGAREEFAEFGEGR